MQNCAKSLPRRVLLQTLEVITPYSIQVITSDDKVPLAYEEL